MKKMLILLLALLCMVPPVFAEESCPLEFQMELSQTQFAEPGEVTVTISVTNVSGADMPGPMALYWPDGRIIEEFGLQTLLADETRIWQGVWNVTAEQLNAGKVYFAAQYTRAAADGSLGRKVQGFYTAVAWGKKPPQTAVIVLKGNRTTGFDWSWEIDKENMVAVDCDYVVNWQPENEGDIMPPGVGGCCNITLTGLAPGTATITFTYRRPWEEKEPLYTLVYRVSVDEKLNVTILGSSFDW